MCWILASSLLPLAVNDRVNVLGRTKRLMIVFTDCLGRAIGDYTPMVNEAGEEDESVVNDLYSSVPPAPAGMPGVALVFAVASVKRLFARCQLPRRQRGRRP